MEERIWQGGGLPIFTWKVLAKTLCVCICRCAKQCCYGSRISTVGRLRSSFKKRLLSTEHLINIGNVLYIMFSTPIVYFGV